MLRETSCKYKTIAKQFGVSVATICDINSGKSWLKDGEHYPIRIVIANKRELSYCKICGKEISYSAQYCKKCYYKEKRSVERPTAIRLAKIVIDSGFEAVGREFGVSGRMIQKWCRSYGIPHNKQKLIAWYYEQMNIAPEPKKQRVPMSEIVRQVKQIDKQTGEVLDIFSSIREAARAIGHANGDRHIGDVCRCKRKTAFGYIWQFA